MVVLVVLATTFLNMVVVNVKSSGSQYSSDRALYLAEAGVQEAVYYLRNTAPDGSTNGTWRTVGYSGGTPSTPCTGWTSPTNPCQETLGDGSYTVWAEDSGNYQIKITSAGTCNGLTRTVQAYATRAGNLLGWWKFEENTLTNASDSSGNNYYGTITSNAMWSATHQMGSYALSFNGTSQEGHAGITPVSPATVITVSAWVYPTTTAGTHSIAGTWNDNSGNFKTYLLWQSATHFAFSIAHTNAGATITITGSTAITASTWYFVTGTFDGTNLNLYVNGSSDATAVSNSGVIATNSKPFYIGDAPKGAAHTYFTGNLDDVRFYNRALTSTEVTALYNSGSGPASDSYLNQGAAVQVSLIYDPWSEL